MELKSQHYFGGDNLGQIDDIVYFQKRLYRALNVPVNRLEQEAQFSLGRSTEISRDELKFQKFVDRLRKRFSHVFLGILKKQLILKGIITVQDWDTWKNDIVIDYVKDNHFTELKESEILRERMQLVSEADQYVGNYFSKEWIWKNVLRFSDDDIEDMKKKMDEEENAGEVSDDPEDRPKSPTNNAPEREPEPKPEVPPEPKEEGYVHTQEDELIESMTRYMNKMNGDD